MIAATIDNIQRRLLSMPQLALLFVRFGFNLLSAGRYRYISAHILQATPALKDLVISSIILSMAMPYSYARW